MMRMSARLLLVMLLAGPVICLGQKPDTLIKKLDSLHQKTDSAGKQENNINQQAYNETTKITFRTYFILLGSDFKQQVTAPLHGTKKDWERAGMFALVLGGLAFADEP